MQRTPLFLLVCYCITLIIANIDFSAVSILLPRMSHFFHVSISSGGWLLAMYGMATAISLLIFAKILDFIPANSVYIIGVALFAISSISISILPNFDTIILMRFLQGLSGGMFISAGRVLFVSLYPKERRNKALGVIGACAALALVCGPMIGGLIERYYSWQYLFWANVPLCFSILFFMATKVPCFIKDSIPKKMKRFDIVGGAMLVLGICLFYLMNYLFTSVGVSIYSVLLVIVSLGLIFSYVWRHIRVPDPFLPKALIMNNAFLICLIGRVGVTAGLMLLITTISLILQEYSGYSVINASLLISPTLIGFAIASNVAGRILKYIEAENLIVFGLGLSWILIATLCIMPHGMFSMIVLLSIIGAGFGLSNVPLSSLSIKVVESSEVALSYALMNSISYIALSVVIIVMTSGLEFFRQEGDFQYGFYLLMLIESLLILPYVLIMFFRRNKSYKNKRGNKEVKS